MTEFCQTLFTMTAAATVAALAVMLLRLLLKRVPRSILCVLWLVVLFRMVCPISFEAPVSLVPDQITSGQVTQQVLPAPAVTTTAPATSETAPVPTQPDIPAPVQTTQPDPYGILFGVWAVGAGIMALWAIISYLKLRHRVADAVLMRDNIYETDRVDTPFVCGFIKPHIYLPAGMDPTHVPHVVRHEQAHIKRLDHISKPFFWLALCLHWFNPVLWLAYILFCRDLETACDQRVVRDLDRQGTADYAAALLCLGRDRSLPQAVPLAFGEENAKGRVKGVLHYKKPAFWVVILAVVLCVGAGFLLLADSQQGESLEGVTITQASYHHARYVYPNEDGSIHTTPVTGELPEDLISRLVGLLEKYGHEEYELPIILNAHEMELEDPPETRPIAGKLYELDLTSPEHTTHFYFFLYENGDGRLTRITYADGDQTTKTKQQAAYIPGLALQEDFQAWETDLQTYLEEQESSWDYTPSPLTFDGIEIMGGELRELVYSWNTSEWNMLEDSSHRIGATHICPDSLLEDLLTILETTPHDPEQDFTGVRSYDLIAGKLEDIGFYNQDWSHMYSLMLSSDGRYLLNHMDEKAGTWKMVYYPELADSPDFQAWLSRLETYLTTVIPDQLYSKGVDSVEKARPILGDLYIDSVVGPYTMKTSPNTITIQAETVYTQDEIEHHRKHYLMWASARIIDLVEDAYHIVWEYPGPEGCTWEYNSTQKAQSAEEFRERYNSEKTVLE
ncbi:MAG: hypothetical protein IKK50_08700 [Ruminiclostridium sp.]|nr:hypothetical protein [Ruminiclostridium sp.]